MSRSESDSGSSIVADYTFSRFESRIRRSPSLIFPIGGLEPVGSRLTLGTVNTICGLIAEALSDRLSAAVAPVLPYGATVPFKSFGGSAGMSSASLSNLVTECCKCWFFQGIKRIMILTLSMDAKRWGAAVVNRLSCSDENVDVRLASLQEDERFRRLCGRSAGGEPIRSEWGITALAAFLCPRNISSSEKMPVQRHGTSDRFRQWYRRGRDPEKMRKLFPGASFTGDQLPVADAVAGKTLYEALLQFLTDDYSPFFATGEHASR